MREVPFLHPYLRFNQTTGDCPFVLSDGNADQDGQAGEVGGVIWLVARRAKVFPNSE